MNFGGAISGIGSFIAGNQEAAGLNAAADLLDQAAGMEKTNEKLTDVSTGLQNYGLEREVRRIQRGTEADQFTAGFTYSGSAIDVNRSSGLQGALGKAINTNQGAIEKTGYAIEALSFQAQATLDRSQADAAQTSGMFSMLSGFMGMFG